MKQKKIPIFEKQIEHLQELQEQMHIHAEKDMEQHPEIFEGESLKEIEKGRNSDCDKRSISRDV